MDKLVFKAWIAGIEGLGVAARLLRRQEGQAAVEYGLIIGFVALVVIAAFTLLGGRVRGAINAVANAINVNPQ